MKNVFHFTSKALFVLKIFKFLSWLFGHAAKRLDKKDQVSFKFYDVAAWLIFWCFVPVGKRSNSCSQMFYKTDAITNLAIFTRKHLCWSFFLINLIKKRLQHRCFPVNIAKCLSTAFYIEHFVRIQYTFQNFYVMIEFFGFFRYKIYFPYFLYHCFVFLHNSSVRIGSPLLFRIYLVFIPKFVLSVTFARIKTTAPSLSWLNR